MPHKEEDIPRKIQYFDDFFKMVITVTFIIPITPTNLDIILLIISLILWSIGHIAHKNLFIQIFAKLVSWQHISFLATTRVIKVLYGASILDSQLKIFSILISSTLTLTIFQWFKNDMDDDEKYVMQRKITTIIFSFTLLISYTSL